MDYEHTPANHVSFRLADRVVLPSVVPFTAVRKYGAKPTKIVRYDGFKEQVYLDGFHPNGRSLDGLPLEMWDQFVVAVARPPAEFAIYHRFKNPLFARWLERAGQEPGVRVVALPRTSEQGVRLTRMRLPSVIVPASPLRGADLVARADLVVSAGGTMNREAAVLGVPAYSLFAGRVAAVDRALEGLGRLTFVRNEDELDRIRLVKKGPGNPLRNPGLVSRVVDRILER
jgi:predicted glycosyltransferase